MKPPQNPYDVDGFHAEAIAAGRHRDVVGGRWEETGRVQMALLRDAGLLPHHHLLDIGAGSLRLGCKAVSYLEPGHYWATDASRALMLAGHAAELNEPARLNPDHLIEDARFDYPAVPGCITHAIAFTVFLAPNATEATTAYRQPDGVVTHDIRPPYHILSEDVDHIARITGWQALRSPLRLPRGQVLYTAQPLR